MTIVLKLWEMFMVKARFPIKSFINYGEIAQLVEQWAENSCVVGSNPALTT